jgi:DNA mismatch repair ATPase MutS
MNKLKEAYVHMKERHGKDVIILFRNGDCVEAYMEDVKPVSEILTLIPATRDGIPVVNFPYTELETNMNRLLDAGYAACFSEMQDSSGNYVTDYAHE